MKNIIYLILTLIIASTLSSCHQIDDPRVKDEMVVVANRGDGSISFINAKDQMVNTLMIPDSEPMYVVYVPAKDKIYVGDRATNKIHIINPETQLAEGEIAVGNGVFHMWADGRGNQLWVNNDVDNTISVVDLNTNMVIKTIDVGAKPHDVFVSINGLKAYVSVIISGNTPDKILMYSTATFEKLAETSVGNDPHLFQFPKGEKLFVPCQSGQLFVLDGDDLTIDSSITLEGAHGIFGSPNQKYLFISNISGDELYTVSTSELSNGIPLARLTQNTSSAISTIASLEVTPHNLVVNFNGDRLFVSHSGATADQVSIYKIMDDGVLSPITTVTTATNPFGIAYFIR